MSIKLDKKQWEKSIRARWGAALASSPLGYTTVPNVLLERYKDLGITDSELVFILQVFRFKWDVELPFPALIRVAKFMKKNRRTVQRYAQSLEKKKLLKRYFREYNTNKYNFSLLIEKLEELDIGMKVPGGGSQKETDDQTKPPTKEDTLRRYNENNTFFKRIGNLIKR